MRTRKQAAIVGEFPRNLARENQIWFVENRGSKFAAVSGEVLYPSGIRLAPVGSRTGSNNEPIDGGRANHGKSYRAKEGFAGEEFNRCVYFRQVFERGICHLLVVSRYADPAVSWIRGKFRKTLGVLRQKLEGFVRAFLDDAKDLFMPFFRDPISKHVRNGSNEDSFGPFLHKRLSDTIRMKRWFEGTTEPLVHGGSVTVGATMFASGYRVPTVVCPFDTGFVHFFYLLFKLYFLGGRKSMQFIQNQQLTSSFCCLTLRIFMGIKRLIFDLGAFFKVKTGRVAPLAQYLVIFSCFFDGLCKYLFYLSLQTSNFYGDGRTLGTPYYWGYGK